MMNNVSSTPAQQWAFFKKTLAGTYGSEIGAAYETAQWSKYMRRGKADDYKIEVQEVVGMGNYKVKEPGQNAQTDQVGQGVQKTLKVQTYARQLVFPIEIKKFRKYKEASDAVQQLKDSAIRSLEYQAAENIDNAFTTFTSADGVAWFSASHTLRGGGTQSNVPGAYSPSNQALQIFWAAMRKCKGTSDLVYGVKAQCLLTASDKKLRWDEILKSSMKDDTTNNTENVVKGMFPKGVVDVPQIGSTTFWGIITDAKHGLTRYIAEDPRLEDEHSAEALADRTVGYYMNVDGVPDFRGGFASSA